MNFTALIQQSILKNPGLENKFITLATVTAKGLPSVERLSLEISFKTKNLSFTPIPSRKVKKLENNDGVQVCWYFKQSREQYLISGSCTSF
jgi:pyridoxine/pyridoxamine 5'-phosphate oxidase